MIMPRLTAICALAIFATTTLGVEPSVTFLSTAEGRAVLQKDDDYLSRLQPLDMAAQAQHPIDGDTLEAQREIFRRHLHDAVLEFSAPEKEAVLWYIQQLDAPLRQDYSKLAALPWRFIKTNNLVEGGLPHTRGDCIVLPRQMLGQLMVMRKILPADKAMAVMGVILVHEQMHVYQRTQPGALNVLYEAAGFMHVDESRIGQRDWILAHGMVNPDGPDIGWILKVEHEGRTRYIWPGVILNPSARIPRLPQDMQMIAVELQSDGERFVVPLGTGGIPIYDEIHDNELYMKSLPHVMNFYHPNEIFADLVSWGFALDHYFDDATPQMREQMRQTVQPWSQRLKRHFAAD
jgi:hypothetical protein